MNLCHELPKHALETALLSRLQDEQIPASAICIQDSFGGKEIIVRLLGLAGDPPRLIRVTWYPGQNVHNSLNYLIRDLKEQYAKCVAPASN